MIPISVTTVLGCPRAYQYELERVERLPPHFYSMRGTMVHRAVEWHFREGFAVGRFEDFAEQLRAWNVEEGSYLENQLKSSFFDLCESVSEWFGKTKLDVSRDSVLAVEAEMDMPIRGDYYLRGHADIITKTHIIDFKSGGLYRNYDYMKQLGAYRDLARYLGLHDESLAGDFGLVNVFLGERNGLGEVVYAQGDVDRVMPEFYSSFFELVAEDEAKRGNPEYMMPCRLSTVCGFCDFRGHPCRGI